MQLGLKTNSKAVDEYSKIVSKLQIVDPTTTPYMTQNCRKSKKRQITVLPVKARAASIWTSVVRQVEVWGWSTLSQSRLY